MRSSLRVRESGPRTQGQALSTRLSTPGAGSASHSPDTCSVSVVLCPVSYQHTCLEKKEKSTGAQGSAFVAPQHRCLKPKSDLQSEGGGCFATRGDSIPVAQSLSWQTKQICPHLMKHHVLVPYGASAVAAIEYPGFGSVPLAQSVSCQKSNLMRT